ncbi:MAG: hypothetical protein IJU95_05520 [Treponema sp.]|nr:hypothetical protein [Treponema sp.]
MPKVKNIAYPAVAGFALSFLISILVTHHFWYSLGKGLLFALVFAVLSFVIDFVWAKFLGEGDDVPELSNDSSKSDKNLGNKVDITIDDADLSDDGRSLPFAVDRNRAKLSDADTQDLRKNDVLYAAESQGDRPSLFEKTVPPSSSAPAEMKKNTASAEPQAGAFKPVSLGKSISDSDSKADASKPVAVSSVPDKSASSPERKTAVSGGDLVGLPDIGGFDNDDNYVSDSDLEGGAASGVGSVDYSSSSASSSGNASKATEHDTATLAKAISTVLKRDEMS